MLLTDFIAELAHFPICPLVTPIGMVVYKIDSVKDDVIKGRVPLLENRRVYGHRLCLLFSQNRIPGASPRKNPLHFTTDIL